MKSLYISPQNTENNPISSSRYLISTNVFNSEWFLRCFSHIHKTMAKIRNTDPCPTSPNITPKRNGKVTMLKYAGFASLY